MLLIRVVAVVSAPAAVDRAAFLAGAEKTALDAAPASLT
jgi:hypothetical protein